MPSDDLVVHKDGRTRRATDQDHFDLLVRSGWKKGYPHSKPEPEPEPEPEQG